MGMQTWFCQNSQFFFFFFCLFWFLEVWNLHVFFSEMSYRHTQTYVQLIKKLFYHTGVGQTKQVFKPDLLYGHSSSLLLSLVFLRCLSRMKKFHSIPNLIRVFIMNGCWNMSNNCFVFLKEWCDFCSWINIVYFINF